jgi:DNA-binding NtrC family response regulator
MAMTRVKAKNSEVLMSGEAGTGKLPTSPMTRHIAAEAMHTAAMVALKGMSAYLNMAGTMKMIHDIATNVIAPDASSDFTEAFLV